MTGRLVRVAMLSLALACANTTATLAAAPILSAPQIQAQVAAGEMILLDIRTPEEWQETGLAERAWPVSMHRRDFPRHLRTILAAYPAERVALICATGGRTARIARLLEQNDIAGVTDVSEGMFGNRNGPGWIARGLPVVSLDTARRALAEQFPSIAE